MDVEKDIPEPVKFNQLKHHKGFILDALEKLQPEEAFDLYKSVNHNYIDIYTGSITPVQLCNEVISLLKDLDVFEEIKFLKWTTHIRNYRKIQISDGSEWIIRLGTEENRYIHIHPAKTGSFTVRFKGSTLKTAYCLKISGYNAESLLTLEMINKARINIGLSPVKKLEPGKGILNCWQRLFSDHYS
ncbi:MAG: hypothetical protein JXR31_16860 [Prolixibacteraceae bacterium]|nr:hypothetical protein [Prolixibacteraceae bacterium]MBN2775929.1 hypothetical protein [Prolixibacteraceae bacterium]